MKNTVLSHLMPWDEVQDKSMPVQALRVPGVWASKISRQSAHEGGNVASPRHLPSLPPRKYSWFSFLLEAKPSPRPWYYRKDYVIKKFQWHHQESKPTFWLVAQILNKLSHRLPPPQITLIFRYNNFGGMRNNYRQNRRENRAQKYDILTHNSRQETVRGHSNARCGPRN
jgi:hypothetical protein